ncbi:hypothetical protein BDW68DRAFT_93928 [Aspergillus falconensis]
MCKCTYIMTMALTSCIGTSWLEAMPVRISSAIPNKIQDNLIPSPTVLSRSDFPLPVSGRWHVTCCCIPIDDPIRDSVAVLLRSPSFSVTSPTRSRPVIGNSRSPASAPSIVK